jgi:hypothetical protein
MSENFNMSELPLLRCFSLFYWRARTCSESGWLGALDYFFLRTIATIGLDIAKSVFQFMGLMAPAR